MFWGRVSNSWHPRPATVWVTRGVSCYWLRKGCTSPWQKDGFSYSDLIHLGMTSLLVTQWWLCSFQEENLSQTVGSLLLWRRNQDTLKLWLAEWPHSSLWRIGEVKWDVGKSLPWARFPKVLGLFFNLCGVGLGGSHRRFAEKLSELLDLKHFKLCLEPIHCPWFWCSLMQTSGILLSLVKPQAPHCPGLDDTAAEPRERSGTGPEGARAPLPKSSVVSTVLFLSISLYQSWFWYSSDVVFYLEALEES